MPSSEFRVAVGDPTGRRSTVWKFEVQGDEIYIFTRMFGSDAKVSLHSTGHCQWSATDSWVRREPGRRNADRHMSKWNVNWPNESEALETFHVRIPESELRVISGAEKLSRVKWLPTPPPRHAVSLECYVTPARPDDPTSSSELPYSLLKSLQLRNGRWFIVLQNIVSIDPADIERVRQEIQEQCSREGSELKPEHRATVLGHNATGVRTLMELCPFGA